MSSNTMNFNRGIVYAILSATCYGLLAVLFKYGYGLGMSTGSMLSSRFILAAIIFLPYVLISKRDRLRVSGNVLFRAFICGTIFYGLQSYFFAASIQYISASTAGLILYIYPMTVVILARIFFKTPITTARLLALVLIMIGCSCVFYDAFSRKMSMQGVTLAILAMLTFSGYLIFIQKSLKNVDSTVFSFYVAVFVALQCIVVYRPDSMFTMTSQQWFLAVLLALIPTVLAMVLLYKAIECFGSTHTSIFSSVEPAVTIIASALLLHDKIIAVQVLGMVFIVAGIVLPNIRTIVSGHRHRTLPRSGRPT